MKTFDLPAAARLKLLKTTPNKEHHGDQLVQAISLRLAWETTNENLALLHPQLKDMLFWRPPQMDAQQTVEGVPETTPFLRVPAAALPLKLDASFTGYTLTIEHGIDDSSALELYVCTLQKFTVDAKEGGTTTIVWSLGSNKQITRELVGELCELEGSEIVATLTPPAMDAGPVIDGSTEAFKADHPDAPDLFDTGASDQHAGDFGTDTGAPGAGDSDEPNWPEPGADSAGAADGDAAEFEAGVQKALDDAGVAPKAARRGRRPAATVQ